MKEVLDDSIPTYGEDGDLMKEALEDRIPDDDFWKNIPARILEDESVPMWNVDLAEDLNLLQEDLVLIENIEDLN